MEAVACQLMRAVRGRRSQIAFARRLGYRANPITDWENGRRFPTATEALRACQRAGIDISASFARFHPATPPDPQVGDAEVAAWLSELRGSTPVIELAERVGRSRFAIARWLSGQAQPRLPDFLHMVDALTGRLPDLIAELVPIDQVPALKARHEATAAARRLAFEFPWTEAVLRLLETRAYRAAPHSDAWLAAHLGIDEARLQDALARLAAAQIVIHDGSHYEVAGSLSVDTRAGPEAVRGLLGHWSQVALDRYALRPDHDLFAYNVMAISEADLLRIRELLRTTFREVRTIVANSQPCETAALLNLQLTTFLPPNPVAPPAPATPKRADNEPAS